MTLGREVLVFDADVPVDARVAAVSAAQWGPVSLGQLRRCGLSESAISRRCQRGQLHRRHRGVYVPGHVGLPRLGPIAAGVLACGNGACACGRTAGSLRELRAYRGAFVHVAVRCPSGRRHDGVRTHSAARLRPRDVAIVEGIPTTSVARTLLDCAAGLKPRTVETMIQAAVDERVFDLAEVEDLLAVVTRHPGRGVLSDALGLAAVARGATRSGYEHDLLEAFRALGTGEPECNPPLFLPGGDVVYPDFLWPSGALVVEADPRSTHDRTDSYRSDRERDRKLDAIGLQTMRFHDLDLLDPAACARETLRRLTVRRSQGHEFRPLSGRNS